MSTAIFIFTRDLRLEDNIPLIEALKTNTYVLPIFVFNPVQITDKNSYKSNNSVQFMIECLDELDETLKKKGSRLFYFYGDTSDIVKKIIKKSDKYEISSVYISQDYTFFAKKREKDLAKVCKELEINLNVIENHMLTGVDKVKKDNGEYYKKFTPYYRVALKLDINEPLKNSYKNYIKKSYGFDFEYEKDIHKFYKKNDDILVHGGRENALKILKTIKNFTDYNTSREIPSIRGTTYLSAYLKFNVVSVREVYKCFDKILSGKNKLFTQLYWRDFYMHIMYHYNPIKSNRTYDLKWENNANWIKKWKTGTTGIPIIDAAMTQMNTTGWMHNRCRMIVSNFLIKVMRCDWTIGEKYFAQMLVDYDFSSNLGGWIWSCGGQKLSGFDFSLDSQPYFRVFNPWRQAETYDAECEYIKKWLPELKDIPAKDILNWNDSEIREKYKNIDYPKPMIEDIQAEFKKTLKLIK
jgi:deoxyribodipyrimidine photo-lyase